MQRFFHRPSLKFATIDQRVMKLFKPHFQNAQIDRQGLQLLAPVLMAYNDKQRAQFMKELRIIMNELKSTKIAEIELVEAMARTEYGYAADFQNPFELRRAAAHETGHLVAAVVLNETATYAEVVQRGNSLGFVATDPDRKNCDSNTFWLDSACIALAGAAGEELAGYQVGRLSPGDYMQARNASMEIEKGMLFEQSTILLRQQTQRAKQILVKHEKLRQAVFNALIEKRKLYHGEILQIVNEHLPESKSCVSSLRK